MALWVHNYTEIDFGASYDKEKIDARLNIQIWDESNTLQGKVRGHGVKVDMTGGQLIIDVERDGSQITDLFLTGPTNIVAKGEVTDEDLTITP